MLVVISGNVVLIGAHTHTHTHTNRATNSKQVHVYMFGYSYVQMFVSSDVHMFICNIIASRDH